MSVVILLELPWRRTEVMLRDRKVMLIRELSRRRRGRHRRQKVDFIHVFYLRILRLL